MNKRDWSWLAILWLVTSVGVARAGGPPSVPRSLRPMMRNGTFYEALAAPSPAPAILRNLDQMFNASYVPANLALTVASGQNPNAPTGCGDSTYADGTPIHRNAEQVLNCVYWNGTLYVTGAGGGGSGSITTTGSPASGNLATFSSSTSITNGDLSGDVTTRGTLATTVAKVNGSTPGGSCTNQAVTALSTSAVPTCTTLTSSYVDISIAKTGTDIDSSNQVTATHLASALPIAQGGTGQTSASAAFNALSPLTTEGDLLYYHSSANARLGVGTNGQCLTSNGTDPSWGSCGGSGTVTVVSSASLTSTALVTGGGTTLIQTPSATSSLDSSGNISTPGSVAAGAGSGTTSIINFPTPGTAPAAPATGFNLIAPATLTTPYNLAAPTGLIPNGHFLTCTTASVTCTLTDGGTGTVSPIIFFQSETVATNQGVGTALTQNHVKVASFFVPEPITFSTIGWSITTADNTSNLYVIGVYGPNCYNALPNIPKVADTGQIAGTAAAPSTGLYTAGAVGAPVTGQPGYYCFAYTSNAASPTAVFGGSSSSTIFVTPFALTDLGAIGGASLPVTITAPALSVALNSKIFTVLF